MAKKYLSAKELGISPGAREALMKTIKALETGNIKYKHASQLKWEGGGKRSNRPKRPAKFFNMDYWRAYPDCGTVGCIGGWMKYFGWNGGKQTDALGQLFYEYPKQKTPFASCEKRITGKRAARVAKNYLRTGEVDWSLAGV